MCPPPPLFASYDMTRARFSFSSTEPLPFAHVEKRCACLPHVHECWHSFIPAEMLKDGYSSIFPRVFDTTKQIVQVLIRKSRD